MDTNNDLFVLQEETEKRISICTACDSLVQDDVPKCKHCACSLSMMTTLKFKQCPEGKW